MSEIFKANHDLHIFINLVEIFKHSVSDESSILSTGSPLSKRFLEFHEVFTEVLTLQISTILYYIK